MAFVGNLLWFVFFGGFVAWLGWVLLGPIFCCTIIGIPFGIASFRIAGFAAFPFGKDLVDVQLLGGKRIIGTGIMNFFWVIFAGFWLAIAHAVYGAVCFLLFFLVFPVYFGLAHFKLAAVCFAPLGKRSVSRQMADEARRRGVVNSLDKMQGL